MKDTTDPCKAFARKKQQLNTVTIRSSSGDSLMIILLHSSTIMIKVWPVTQGLMNSMKAWLSQSTSKCPEESP
jgi:hypothetical protein